MAEHVAREFSKPLLAFLARKLSSREEAEDLFQEVLEGLLSIERHQVKAPLAYAMKCASAVIAAHYKENKLRPVSLHDIASEQMEDLHEDSIRAVEFGEDVLAVLRRLPRSVQRDVYIQRLLLGTPFPQIAKELNVSVPVAYNYYHATSKKVWELLSVPEAGKK